MCGIDLQVLYDDDCFCCCSRSSVADKRDDNGGGLRQDNVHGVDGEEDDEEDAATTTTATTTTSWLTRRGPDHVGCVAFTATPSTPTTKTTVVDDGGDAVSDGATTSTTAITAQPALPRVVVRFRASVLRMRRQLVQQPVRIRTTTTAVQLRSRRRRRTTAASTTDNSTKEKEEDEGDDRQQQQHRNSSSLVLSDDDGDDYYLAWNGEVYQRRIVATSTSTGTGDAAVRTKKNETGATAAAANEAADSTAPPAGAVEVEDTWQYDRSDTELVSELFRRAIDEATADRNLEQQEQEEEGTTSSTSLEYRLLSKFANEVVPSLCNAEFAFCLVVKSIDSVFFGRDKFGCRSLLVYDSDDNCGRDCADNRTDVCERRRNPQRRRHPFWRLSSVASRGVNNNEDEYWSEVRPGRVYCYNCVTRKTTSLPIGSSSSHTSLTNARNNDDILAPSSLRTDCGGMVRASRQLQGLLLEAVRRRIQGCQHGDGVSILFSGGVDSVVLAGLALTLLNPTTSDDDSTVLTLINVSFVDNTENNNRAGGIDGSRDNETAAADTVAARASYEELVQMFPEHKIRFVQRQVDWSEIRAVEDRVRRLIFPKTTTMDVNIATALWFAASASDSSYSEKGVSSPPMPRILLTGLGADEQMGGYGRHRKAWEKGGNELLRRELDLDLHRLWDRNLGRDDRVLSDSAKEAVCWPRRMHPFIRSSAGYRVFACQFLTNSFIPSQTAISFLGRRRRFFPGAAASRRSVRLRAASGRGRQADLAPRGRSAGASVGGRRREARNSVREPHRARVRQATIRFAAKGIGRMQGVVASLLLHSQTS